MPLNAVATHGAKTAPFLAIGWLLLSNILHKFQKSVHLEAFRSLCVSLTVDGSMESMPLPRFWR